MNEARICKKQIHVIPPGKRGCQDCANARARVKYHDDIVVARQKNNAKQKQIRETDPNYFQAKAVEDSKTFRVENPGYHAAKMRALRAKRRDNVE